MISSKQILSALFAVVILPAASAQNINAAQTVKNINDITGLSQALESPPANLVITISDDKIKRQAINAGQIVKNINDITGLSQALENPPVNAVITGPISRVKRAMVMNEEA